MKEYYENDKTRAVEEAKIEAMEKYFWGGLQQHQPQFDHEKDRVLHQLRMEIHRHQLELTRLRAELENMGGGAKEN